jgi:diguanylate cyclase (GGDEF)-like protein/PAS domain S-box-containing protein
MTLNLRVIRFSTYALLAIVLVVGCAAAWVTLNALAGKAGDLVRHARVDAWTTQQTEHQTYRFLLALSEHVAGNQAVGLVDVRGHLSDLKSTARFLNLHERSPEIQVIPGKEDLRSDFLAALSTIEASLTDRVDVRGDVALLLEARAALSPWLTDLQELLVNLTHIRIELQKRDLANASTLIGFNRQLLLAIAVFGAIFLTLVSVEARDARRAEAAAREAEASARIERGRFQDFAETASDWLWETDANLQLTFVSDQIEAFSGLSADSYLDQAVSGFLKRLDAESNTDGLDDMLSRQSAFRNLLVGSEDQQRFLSISGNPTYDDAGAFIGFRGTCSDISDDVRREGRIRFLAEHDHLTGLANRAFLQKQLRIILEGERFDDRQGFLLMLDLDGFKDINDTFGHDVGDALIVALGDRLRGELRRTDLIARLGGDEFAIVRCGEDLTEISGEMLSDRVLALVKQPFNVKGYEFVVGTSIGIARFPEDGTTVEALMKAGDLALYAAKAADGDRAIPYHIGMSQHLERRRQLEHDLRLALETDALDLYVQPQFDFVRERFIGGEALLRWHHVELGPISPEVFIPIAEETGLILPLGRWVLETACSMAKRWSDTFEDGLIAVNISPAQFTHQDLVQEVTDVLARTGLPPKNLELEITEGLLMRDHQLAIDMLGRLDEMGVKLAIDDFGTGYSSLSYLKRFRVHKVKIDKAFVRDLEHDRGDHSIVQAVVMMSKAFGFQTIAEGEETPAQRNRLIALGCDQAQGYFYGKPQPIQHFFEDYAKLRAPMMAGINSPA